MPATQSLSYRPGDVITQRRVDDSERATKRGVVVTAERLPTYLQRAGLSSDTMVVQTSGSSWIFSDNWYRDWDSVPWDQQTPTERIWSASKAWAAADPRSRIRRQPFDWALMLAFVPLSPEDQRLAARHYGDFTLLALHVAKWVDPVKVLPRVQQAIIDWRSKLVDDGFSSMWHDLAWRAWFAFLPPALQEYIKEHDWPDFEEVAILAANEAEHQHRQRLARERAMARLEAE